MDPPAQRLAAVFALVVIYWVTEAIPLAVTALLGVALAVALGAADTQTAFAGFSDPTVFLLIGSFLLVEATRAHGLDQRIAYGLMAHPWVGDSSYRTLWAVGLTAVIVSAWVSNSATAAMLYPAVVAVARASVTHSPTGTASRYQTALLLMLAYGVSIGGMVTPVGTPTNLLGLGLLEATTNTRVAFLEWTLIGGITAAVLLPVLFGFLILLSRPEARQIPGQQQIAHAAIDELGHWTRAQKLVAAIFVVAVALWLLPGLLELLPGAGSDSAASFRGRLPEGVVALLAAAFLFILPAGGGRKLLTWEQASALNWGTILLLGGCCSRTHGTGNWTGSIHWQEGIERTRHGEPRPSPRRRYHSRARV